MPKLATVIELPGVPTTEPLVRRARVSAPVGAIAAVTFMVPELSPSTSPILTTLAIRRFSSSSTRDSLPSVFVPRSIWRLFVTGLTTTAPELSVADTFASIAIASAFIRTPEVPAAVMVEPRVIPEAVTVVFPAEFRAPEPELVKAPNVVTVMSPELVARLAPTVMSGVLADDPMVILDGSVVKEIFPELNLKSDAVPEFLSVVP
jgi:hypothetical protein